MQESSVNQCENYLRSQRSVFIEKEMWPSKIPVIDRILQARDEMRIVYNELVGKLAERHWKLALDKILDESVMSAPDVTKEARLQRNELVIVNEQITSVANQLADLLHKRRELKESSGFSDGTCFHIVNLIDKAASQSNSHYRSFLQKTLGTLKGQFDLKYWPTLAEIVQVLANDAEQAEVNARDPILEVAVQGNRHSSQGYFLALIESFKTDLPYQFKLTDKSLAIVGSWALSTDKPFSAEYVKNLRHRHSNRDAMKYDQANFIHEINI